MYNVLCFYFLFTTIFFFFYCNFFSDDINTQCTYWRYRSFALNMFTTTHFSLLLSSLFIAFSSSFWWLSFTQSRHTQTHIRIIRLDLFGCSLLSFIVHVCSFICSRAQIAPFAFCWHCSNRTIFFFNFIYIQTIL